MARPSTRSRPIHRAWWVALAVLGALVVAAGFRSSTGALIEPLEQEFGWSRTMTSGAVTANLVIYGLTAPFAAALMERLGLRRVIVAALLLVGIGSGLTTVMTSPWQLWVLWGGFVGLGAGAMALVLGSVVANRWFESQRGLVTGLFSAASSTGQLVFLPAIAALAAGPGWRYAALVVAGAAFAIIPVIVLVVADRPADVGVRPYGAAPESKPESVVAPTAVVSGRHTEDTGGGPAAAAPARIALQTLGEASHRLSFWLLAGTFFICGWSTNGLIGTHFIPAAHDHGLADRPGGPAAAVGGLLRAAGAVTARRPVGPRAGSRAEPVPLHRLLRVGLGGDRPTDDGVVPGALRAGTLEHRVRLGLRRAHGRGRDRGDLRGLGAPVQRRLLLGVAHRRNPLSHCRIRLLGDPAPGTQRRAIARCHPGRRGAVRRSARIGDQQFGIAPIAQGTVGPPPRLPVVAPLAQPGGAQDRP